jgi:DNA polymerase III delta prime subunit
VRIEKRSGRSPRVPLGDLLWLSWPAKSMPGERNRHLPIAERWRPAHLNEVAGNPRAREELGSWAAKWEGPSPPAQRAALLSGPAGVGKTSAALALAADHGWTVVEMNASDARNESAIEQVAGRASISHTLDGADERGARHRALILLDEADCLTGRLTETPRSRPEPIPLREFLRGRYRTVDALNTAYALTPGGKPAPFTDWDVLPKSPGNASWARLPAARKDIEDWRSSGRPSDLSDRGGLGAIARLVRATRQPVILTVNDERVLTRYSPVFRTAVRRIRFYPLRDSELRGRLEEVSLRERIRLDPGALDAILRRSHGDLRAALNDLDAISPLPPGPAQLGVLGARDRAADLAALTEELLTTPRFYRSVEIQDRIDAPPDELLPWVEENIAHFAPDAAHRAAGFEALEVADRFLAWARRARVWSLWSYGSEMLSGGVALALHEQAVPGGRGIAFPQFLGAMGGSRGSRAVRESLVAKLGTRFHLSHAKSREALLPFLEGLFLAGSERRARPVLKAVARAIVNELDLSSEEVALLLAVEPGSPEVEELLTAAEPGAGRRIQGTSERSEEPTQTTKDDRSAPRRQRQLTDFGG